MQLQLQLKTGTPLNWCRHLHNTLSIFYFCLSRHTWWASRKICCTCSRMGALLQGWVQTCSTSCTWTIYRYWANVWRWRPKIYQEYVWPKHWPNFSSQNPFKTDEYDPTDAATTHDEDTTTLWPWIYWPTAPWFTYSLHRYAWCSDDTQVFDHRLSVPYCKASNN